MWHGEIKKLNYLEMSNHRAKWNQIWDSLVVVQHIWGTLALVAFKVIKRSFSALAIFRNLGLMMR